MDNVSFQGVWQCIAGSAHHSYQIERFEPQTGQARLAIYDSPQINPKNLVEVIEVRMLPNKSAAGIFGTGVTQDRRKISIYAFQRTVDFTVADSTSGVAAGVCSYFSDWQ
jgi:hypothetical protein